MTYAASLEGSPAAEYLDNRGILQVAKRFGLGYVAEPRPGHDLYKGFLSIPYLRKSPDPSVQSGYRNLVISIRYRCINPDCVEVLEDGSTKESHKGHGKYMTVPGGGTRLFNTPALLESSDFVAICEGELDAIVCTMLGIPAVAMPGSDTWQKHWRDPFLGYESVLILGDGDEAGAKLAAQLAKELPNGKPIVMPPNLDVSSYVMKEGAESFKKKLGIIK
ncbi:toprim domain-containing protein [Nocardia rhizosphaerihabitans]|uniref:toprim domain-containing protein n=1 Tax=Nocardia rhizosphaerihabitans TaxID=1691570 RepID=UPI0036730884